MAETNKVTLSTEGGWNCHVTAPWRDSMGYLQEHEDIALQEASHVRLGASIRVTLKGGSAEETKTFRHIKLAGLTAVEEIS